MRLSVLACLLLSAPALAVPLEFNHQGRLFDQTAVPIDTPTNLTFNLYDAPSGGTAMWTESHPGTDFDRGYYSVQLGSQTALDASTFDGDVLYMGIQVGSGPELPGRLRLVSVPYAVRAQDATNVSGGGVVNASEIQINGSTVIDSSGDITAPVSWSDVTGTPETLGELGCSSGDLAIHNGVGWACGVLSSGTIDAGDITTGTVNIDRLPIGDSSSSVAAGDHTHPFNEVTGIAATSQVPDLDASKITGGTFPTARLPVGTGATQVAPGDHSHAISTLTGVATPGQIPNLDASKITSGTLSAGLLPTSAGDIDLGAGSTIGGQPIVTGSSAGLMADYWYVQDNTSQRANGGIPWDNTRPQVSEGVQVLRIDNVAAKKAGNLLVFDAQVNWAETGNTSDYFTMALFQSGDNSAIAASSESASNGNARCSQSGYTIICSQHLRFTWPAPDTASRSYSIRVGLHAGGSNVAIDLNRGQNNPRLGGALHHHLSITEIAQ